MTYRIPALKSARWVPVGMVVIAAVTTATILEPRNAMAAIEIDNINVTSFPTSGSNVRSFTSNGNWVAKTFTVGSSPLILQSLTAALSRNTAATAGSFAIGVYAAAPATPGPIPTGNRLAEASYSCPSCFSTVGNTSVAGTNGFTILGSTGPVNGGLGTLGSFTFMPNTTYSLVFSRPNSGQDISWRSRNPQTTPFYTATPGYLTFNSSVSLTNGTNLGTTSSPISFTGPWVTAANSNTNWLTLEFKEPVPVPAPAFAGISSLLGMIKFSRSLRQRIKVAAAV
jgi:hypothetical protein